MFSSTSENYSSSRKVYMSILLLLCSLSAVKICFDTPSRTTMGMVKETVSETAQVKTNSTTTSDELESYLRAKIDRIDSIETRLDTLATTVESLTTTVDTLTTTVDTLTTAVEATATTDTPTMSPTMNPTMIPTMSPTAISNTETNDGSDESIEDNSSDNEPTIEYSTPMLERDLGTIRVTFDQRKSKTVPYNMNGEMENVAVTMISMGKAPETVQLERCVTTIRKNGGWEGPIYIITDDTYPQYQQLTIDYPNTYMIVADESLFDRKLKNKMQFKRFKMRINELITTFDTSVPVATITADTLLNSDIESPIETIIYLDMDILMGASIDPFLHFIHHLKGKVREFIQDEQQNCSLTTTTPIKPSYAIMFQDLSMPIHSGLIVTDITDSNGCLDQWAELVKEKNYVADQKTLAELIQVGNPPCEQRCAMVRMQLWKDFFLFPTKKSFVDGQVAPFVHLTNTARAKSIGKDAQIDYFNNTLGLPAELFGIDLF